MFFIYLDNNNIFVSSRLLQYIPQLFNKKQNLIFIETEQYVFLTNTWVKLLQSWTNIS